jgi:hypothetical protein
MPLVDPVTMATRSARLRGFASAGMVLTTFIMVRSLLKFSVWTSADPTLDYGTAMAGAFTPHFRYGDYGRVCGSSGNAG